MVVNIIIVLIFLSVFYAYTNHNREFTATASAIQQIWSGTCRLSCRNSEYSGFSGLSGLVPGQTRESGCLTVLNSGLNGCVCESCPCSLVENVLRTCSPATNIYSRSIEFLSDYYYDLVKTLTDLYCYLEQVMRSGVTSERQAQLTFINQLSSGANINFIKKNKVTDDIEKEKVTKSALKVSRSITFRRKSDSNELKYEATSSRASPSIALNLEVPEPIIPERGSLESLQVQSDCSKCIEKGKTCIGICPREKNNKNKMK